VTNNKQPEFLIALFETTSPTASRFPRSSKIPRSFSSWWSINPVSLIVERVSDGRYLLANRGAEAILNRRREDATGLTAADIFNPREAKLDHRARRGGDQEARAAHGRAPDQHQDGLRLFLTRRMTVLDDSGEPQYLIKTTRTSPTAARPNRAWLIWRIMTA